jgi:hypothetical protein
MTHVEADTVQIQASRSPSVESRVLVVVQSEVQFIRHGRQLTSYFTTKTCGLFSQKSEKSLMFECRDVYIFFNIISAQNTRARLYKMDGYETRLKIWIPARMLSSTSTSSSG